MGQRLNTFKEERWNAVWATFGFGPQMINAYAYKTWSKDNRADASVIWN
jgi:hypothetical protein